MPGPHSILFGTDVGFAYVTTCSLLPKQPLKPRKKVALPRQNAEISKQIFPEKEYRGLSPNFRFHASVSDLQYVFPRSVCLFCWRKYVDRSWDYINRHRHMNVEIGAEAALFPEKEYINEIFIAVWHIMS